MASSRVPALRHLASYPLSTSRVSHQRRWAQVHDVRFLVTTQQPRNVYEKYRDKLERKAREEGHGDIETLKKAYTEKIHDVRKSGAPTPPPQPAQSSLETPSPLRPPTSAAATAPPVNPTPSQKSQITPLSSILDLEKARQLPPRELTAIWRLRHADMPQSLCAAIPASTFERMNSLARTHPQFVLPLPHPEQGAEMHFLQWTWDAPSRSATVLFTQLAEYKMRGEWALPHTSLTHYTDLSQETGMVLMRGAVQDNRGVSAEDARWLVLCLQRFYGGWDGEGEVKETEERKAERRRLLEGFSKGDGAFSVEKLLEEAERMG
ncbi:ATP11 protein-domain-containing protein [Coniochaeta sp. 2T2.1]|nr:ATP11 protein-domain-containing protein [Coniochaeta sp. 2T2.1]